ncbi:tol-pal system YbgF family protein, partial [Candidatus Riflebacteria bacterium]
MRVRNFSLFFIFMIAWSFLLPGKLISQSYPGFISPQIQEIVNHALNQNDNYARDQVLKNGVTSARTVDEVIYLASYCFNDFNRDAILTSGTNLARDVLDILRLAREARNGYNKDQILLKRVNLAKNVNDVIQLAQATDSSYNRDQILIEGIKLARNSYELQCLANATDNEYTRQRILGSNPGGGTNYPPTYPPPGNDQLTIARQHFNQGEYYKTRNMFYQALSSYNLGKIYRNVYGAKCLYFAGYSNVKLGRYYDAERDYAQYIQIYPAGEQIIPANFVLGRVYEAQGNYYQARVQYQKIIQLYPYSQYATKARERLNQIGGSYYSTYPNRPYTRLGVTVTEFQKKDIPLKIDTSDPFNDGKKGNLKDFVQSVDKRKTHRSFILKLRHKLTFEKVHGDIESGKL